MNCTWTLSKKHKEGQRSTKKHKEAQRGTKKHKEAQRSTKRHKEAQRSTSTLKIPKTQKASACKATAQCLWVVQFVTMKREGRYKIWDIWTLRAIASSGKLRPAYRRWCSDNEWELSKTPANIEGVPLILKQRAACFIYWPTDLHHSMLNTNEHCLKPLPT